MRAVSIVFSLCALILVSGCKSSDPHAATTVSQVPEPAATASPTPGTLKSRIDPCNLLTSDELQIVQGEALQTTLPSERETPELIIAQCYYRLPTITNSVVVNVTTAKERGKSLKEFWESSHAENEAKPKEGGREEEESRPERISGVGDEAHWAASSLAGALYVLKKNVILRISVGGPGDIKTKLEKSKTLARKALARI